VKGIKFALSYKFFFKNIDIIIGVNIVIPTIIFLGF